MYFRKEYKMQCPICQSNSVSTAKMALLNGVSIGPSVTIRCDTLKLIGPKALQPDWNFYLVGCIIVGLGVWVGLEFHWDTKPLWLFFFGVGLLILFWPIVLYKYRQNRRAKIQKHCEFLDSNWICLSCGHIWPRA